MNQRIRPILILLSILLLSAAAASATVTVTVSTPANNATVCSPVRIAASATTNASGEFVTGWWIYVDSVGVYGTSGPTSSIDTSVSMGVGDHQVMVRAWDSSGAYGSQILTLHVSSCTGGDVITVSVTSPSAGATVASPVRFTASASSSKGNSITGFVVYSDDGEVYQNHVGTLDTWAILPFGSHSIYIRAWDSIGTYGTSSTFTINVQGTVIPTPLTGAVTFNNLDDDTTPPTYLRGWDRCGTTSCAGGRANATTFPMTQNVPSPSRDGASTHFSITGPAYADALWWNNLGAYDTKTNFLWDFWFYLPSSSTTAQAIEFDLYQFTPIGGTNTEFMFGSQCDQGTWDSWNQATHQWVAQSGLPCSFSPNTWHHLIYFVQRIGDGRDKLLYGNVTLDGVTTQWNIQAPTAPTPAGWVANTGVQYQLDIGSSGTSLEEWIDQVKVTMW